MSCIFRVEERDVLIVKERDDSGKEAEAPKSGLQKFL